MDTKDSIIIGSVAIVMLVLYDFTPSVPNFDTPYYLLAGNHLFEGRLDCLRTPTYPVLIQSVKLLFGDMRLAVVMTLIQSLVYLLSVQSLMGLVGRVIRSRYIRLGTVFFYVVVIAPAWCNEIATEALSMSGCVILVDLLFRYLETHRWDTLSLFHLILLILVFLRPTFILFFAILPCLWIYEWVKKHRASRYSLAIIMTMICMGCYLGYTYMYEKEYGKRTSTISFECNTIYNLKRSGCWDLESVLDSCAKEICMIIDNSYTCNYDPVYNVVDTIPSALPLLSSACDEMIKAHKQQYNRYRAETFVSSFDTRFPGAVNTKSPLGVFLFCWTLFLTLPLSLFYLIVPISVVALLVYVVKSKQIPLAETIVIAIVFAQYVGILLSASEAHARLMLPAYGLFLLVIAIDIDYIVRTKYLHRQ